MASTEPSCQDLHCLPFCFDFWLTSVSATTFANSVDPDETAHNEPSHQDPCCLPLCFDFWHTPYLQQWTGPKSMMGKSTEQVIFSFFEDLYFLNVQMIWCIDFIPWLMVETGLKLLSLQKLLSPSLIYHQGPVVQSAISLTGSLVVKLLTVLVI